MNVGVMKVKGLPSPHAYPGAARRVLLSRVPIVVVRSSEANQEEELRERDPERETPSLSLGVRLAEKAELVAQSVLALALGGALAVSTLNILAKVGVITFALVSVAIRYTCVRMNP